MRILIVLPAHNEEEIIEKSVSKVLNFIKNQKNHKWHLMVAENGSKDKTVNILKRLSYKSNLGLFSFKSLPVRSKSDAIRKAWLSRDADIYMYMDADLSTDISHIPELVQGISQGYDITIGSRGLKNSKVQRSMKRNFISKSYNIISRILFSLNVKDLQCGFKAINKKTLYKIVKQTRYLSEGFMDTEMLILANHKKFKIKEIPVLWEDYRKSKFNFFLVAIKFIGNMLKVKKDLILGKYR
jgi:glycosyltransferase involved in cell wall biosynthesis